MVGIFDLIGARVGRQIGLDNILIRFVVVDAVNFSSWIRFQIPKLNYIIAGEKKDFPEIFRRFSGSFR